MDWLRTTATGEGIVDPLSSKLLKELEEMQQCTGRMLRNMSMSRMLNMESGISQPPMDIYESEREFFIYADLAGVDAQSFSVVVEGHQVRIHGRRHLPPHKDIACVHQLEIELGVFDRTVNLPGAVDVESVTSTYTNGILCITLPKRQSKGRVNIAITHGEE
jgi:HSP20 family protein